MSPVVMPGGPTSVNHPYARNCLEYGYHTRPRLRHFKGGKPERVAAEGVTVSMSSCTASFREMGPFRPRPSSGLYVLRPPHDSATSWALSVNRQVCSHQVHASVLGSLRVIPGPMLWPQHDHARICAQRKHCGATT